MKLAGTKTLVVGLEKSGVSAAEFLLRQGAEVRATDLKPEKRAAAEALGIPFALQADTVFENCELIVLSPDVPADLPPIEAARGRGVAVIGEVELAAPYLRGRTIGITGSNGKTTTTSLVGHILREAEVTVQVGGNIGRPVTAMIDSSTDEGWNVLELSSFQTETIFEFRAHIALGLNVTQNHLDRHHTFENYAAAKGRLFETQQAGDFAVLNADDPVCVEYAARTAAATLWFSSRRKVSPGASLCSDKLVLDSKLLMPAGEIPIRGRHNVENVLAASIAAARAGVGHEAIAAAVRTFRAVEHRLEFVRSLNGVDFDDSKATSVDATLKAIDAFPGGLWVILGGKDKGLDYAALREPLLAKARAVLLIGAASAKIAGQLQGTVPLVESGTIDRAVAYGFEHAGSGETVLLAPACASFDQFRSYEHRGEVFKQVVQRVAPEGIEMALRYKTDWILFATVLAMVSFGVLVLYSASSIMAKMDPRFGSSWHFVLRQIGWAVLGITVMMALKRTKYTRFNDPSIAFTAIGIVLMLLAIVYFADTHHRWLRIRGPIGMQPSELAKPALVVFLAFFVTWRGRAINNPRHTLIPAALAVGLVIFGVVVPDLGTAAVLGITAMVVFFVAGLQWRYCFIVAGVAVLGLIVSIFAEPYRLARVVKFFDADFSIVSKYDPAGRIKSRMEETLRTRDTNYQLEQSQMALGAGGPAGLGLMNGKQKLLYLPEAHTDFIYAVVGEELGLAGSVGVLLGFALIFWRGIRASFRMGDDFGRYLALGVTVVVVVQGLINMSVVLGMMPTKGIPLPMISYGGSSLLSTLALLGMLMNVSEHAG